MSETSQNRTVLSVGRLYCDLIFTGAPRLPTLGSEVFATGIGLHAGGGAFITAAHLAQLGMPSALGSFLPNAPFHEVVENELGAAGLDTSLCQPLPLGTEPQLTVAISHAEDRAFLTRKSGDAMPAITPDDLRRLGVRHVHIGEASTLVDCPSIAEAARSANASLSIDCGWDDALTPKEIAEAVAIADLQSL